ncbi:MAG TPA: hypothetical protein QF353_03685 [Gammaproteobacteria bacterium]|nr:hypothetical protein [Gammaproteobacteria bacterium]
MNHEKDWLAWLCCNHSKSQGKQIVIPKQWHKFAESYGLSVQWGANMMWEVPTDKLQSQLIQKYVKYPCDIHVVQSINSTHDHCFYAKELQLYQVFIAEYQTQGKGCKGDPWVACFGENLLVSAVFPFKKSKELAVEIAQALAVCIQAWVPNNKVKVKWPNDVMIDDAKCLGVKVSEPMSDAVDGFIVSFGFNVNMLKGGPRDQRWTSLQKETGVTWDRNYVAGQLLQSILTLSNR